MLRWLRLPFGRPRRSVASAAASDAAAVRDPAVARKAAAAATASGALGASAHGRTPGAVEADEPLATLLADLAKLRLSVAADLSTAAGAADAGRPDIATDLLLATRRDVAAVTARADWLTAPDVLVISSPRSAAEAPRRGLKAARPTLVVALGLALVLVHPWTIGSRPGTNSQPAAAAVDVTLDASVAAEQSAAADHSAPSMQAAIVRVHQRVGQLIPKAAHQPATARQVVAALTSERTVLDRAPNGLARLAAADADQLLNRLRFLADPDVRRLLPNALPALDLPTPTPTPSSSSTPSPAPSASDTTPTTQPPTGGGPAELTAPAPAPVLPAPTTVPTLPSLPPAPAPSPSASTPPSLPNLITSLVSPLPR